MWYCAHWVGGGGAGGELLLATQGRAAHGMGGWRAESASDAPSKDGTLSEISEMRGAGGRAGWRLEIYSRALLLTCLHCPAAAAKLQCSMSLPASSTSRSL